MMDDLNVFFSLNVKHSTVFVGYDFFFILGQQTTFKVWYQMRKLCSVIALRDFQRYKSSKAEMRSTKCNHMTHSFSDQMMRISKTCS